MLHLSGTHTDPNGKYHNHRLMGHCAGQECDSADTEHGYAEVECACAEVEHGCAEVEHACAAVEHGCAEVECACAEVALMLRAVEYS